MCFSGTYVRYCSSALDSNQNDDGDNDCHATKTIRHCNDADVEATGTMLVRMIVATMTRMPRKSRMTIMI